jgi:hypothetical protein
VLSSVLRPEMSGVSSSVPKWKPPSPSPSFASVRRAVPWVPACALPEVVPVASVQTAGWLAVAAVPTATVDAQPLESRLHRLAELGALGALGALAAQAASAPALAAPTQAAAATARSAMSVAETGPCRTSSSHGTPTSSMQSTASFQSPWRIRVRGPPEQGPSGSVPDLQGV